MWIKIPYYSPLFHRVELRSHFTNLLGGLPPERINRFFTNRLEKVWVPWWAVTGVPPTPNWEHHLDEYLNIHTGLLDLSVGWNQLPPRVRKGATGITITREPITENQVDIRRYLGDGPLNWSHHRDIRKIVVKSWDYWTRTVEHSEVVDRDIENRIPRLSTIDALRLGAYSRADEYPDDHVPAVLPDPFHLTRGQDSTDAWAKNDWVHQNSEFFEELGYDPIPRPDRLDFVWPPEVGTEFAGLPEEQRDQITLGYSPQFALRQEIANSEAYFDWETRFYRIRARYFYFLGQLSPERRVPHAYSIRDLFDRSYPADFDLPYQPSTPPLPTEPIEEVPPVAEPAVENQGIFRERVQVLGLELWIEQEGEEIQLEEDFDLVDAQAEDEDLPDQEEDYPILPEDEVPDHPDYFWRD